MPGLRTVLLIAGFFIGLEACAVRKSAPLEGALRTTDTTVRNGQVSFMKYCQKCHPSGESGLGPALNSNPAPGFVKRFQVRHGLGVMPSFDKQEISNTELHDIIAYLHALKHK